MCLSLVNFPHPDFGPVEFTVSHHFGQPAKEWWISSVRPSRVRGLQGLGVCSPRGAVVFGHRI